MEKRYDILALGEVMLRLSPSGENRLVTGKSLDVHLGGAEMNVVTGASLLGMKTALLSKFPGNEIGSYAKRIIASTGTDTSQLVYDRESDARMGLYYFENGALPRKPTVVYDRKYSSFTKIQVEDFSEDIYAATKCFHTTGITLALGGSCRETAVKMIKKFKTAGAKISFDVNFRGNLWSGKEAKECIEEILPMVDYFFCSEDTARLTFLKEGSLEEIMRSFGQEYPLTMVCSTQRVVHSPKCHSFGSKIYDVKKDLFYEELPYENINVVDRIGSGDCYIAGALYGMLSEEGSIMKAVEYGNATAALKTTVAGDMGVSDKNEVELIIKQHKDTKHNFEMNR